MPKLGVWGPLSLLLGLILCATPGSADDTYYRYVNDDGVTVLDSRIPPRHVSKGYEIVSTSGQVLEVVPPAPSPEEAEALAEKRRQQADREAWDKRLRRRYTSVGEIEQAKQRKLEDFDSSLNLLRGNIANIEAQIDNLETRAAERERAGDAIPQVLLENLENLREQLNRGEARLERRERERRELAEQFDRDMERFAAITNG